MFFSSSFLDRASKLLISSLAVIILSGCPGDQATNPTPDSQNGGLPPPVYGTNPSPIDTESNVLGPWYFKSTNFELTRTTTDFTIGNLQTGRYKLKVQNGNYGPFLARTCAAQADSSLRRQCLYDNLIEKTTQEFTRTEKSLGSFNGVKLFAGKTLNRSFAYKEESISLQANNQFAIDVQAFPTASLKMAIDYVPEFSTPVALFSVNSLSGTAPATIKFNAAHSYDADNLDMATLQYEWDFGDGVTATGINPTHVYSTAGTFNARLKVIDQTGRFDDFMAEIFVKAAGTPPPATNKNPVLKLVTTYPDPQNLRKVRVSLADSYDTDGVVTNYTVDFGVSTTANPTLGKFTSQEVEYEYPKDGTYLLKVSITDDLGGKASLTDSLSISTTNDLIAVAKIYGTQTYYGLLTERRITGTFTVQPQDVSALYKLTIKNADGLPHDQKSCTGITGASLLSCQYDNLINKAYVNLERLDYVNVYLNGKLLTDSTSINKTSYIFSTIIAPQEGVNTLEVRLKGNLTAYMQIEINKMEVASATPPILSLRSPRPEENFYSNQSPSNIQVVVDSDKVLQSGTIAGLPAKVVNGNILVATVPFTTAGRNNISVVATDLQGNSKTQSFGFDLIRDQVAPTMTLGIANGAVTNKTFVNLPVVITDSSPTTTSVSMNGQELFLTSAKSFTTPITLPIEGENVITVQSLDAAGNASAVYSVKQIRDTVAPILTFNTLASGAVYQTTSIDVSGTSNEAIQSISIVSASTPIQNLTLSADKKSFTGTVNVPLQGFHEFTVIVTDMASNVKVEVIPFRIVLYVLSGNLITVNPSQDGQHLEILGAPGASIPGITIKANAGFFNTANTTSNQDGSFRILLDPFLEAELKATEVSINRTDTVIVRYGSTAPTILAGKVVDTDGDPISGVTVSLEGNMYKVITDGAGVFSFPSGAFGEGVIPTGDQMLVIDGTTVVPSPQPQKPPMKFSKEKIGITIGLRQSNVIPFNISLQGTPVDTPIVDNSQSAISVSASNDSTVRFDIPANSAVFPDGTKVGQIFLKRNFVKSTVMPVSEFSVPDTVIHLEPSGLKFNSRVKVTLPNENNLPAGVKLVIMSMNPSKGIWEIDGMAEVTSDGQRVETLPNAGISHFSTIYASPMGPKISQIGSKDKPGADAFNGANTVSLKMPSMKVLGSEVAPILQYKSSWAKPTAMISNQFDIPKQEVDITISQGNFLFGTTETNLHMWYQPNRITASFESTNLKTEKVTFKSPPNQVAISYAAELKNQNTSQYFDTNLYPYNSHWELYLDHITIATRRGTPGFISFFDPVSAIISTASVILRSGHSYHTQNIENAFPSDLAGTILVENQINSSVGTGWKIGGVQKIANPAGAKILIQEGDGKLSTYAINNTINTVVDSSETPIDLNQGVDLNQLPKIYLTGSNGNIYSGDLTGLNSGQPLKAFTQIYEQQKLTGNLVEYTSPFRIYPFSITGKNNYLVVSNTEDVYSTSSNHAIYKYVQGNSAGSLVSGYFSVPPTNYNAIEWQHWGTYLCLSIPGASCGRISTYNCYIPDSPTKPWCWECTICPKPWHSDGQFPTANFNGDGAMSGVQWNSPMAMIPGPRPNTLVIADYGNHRVRLVDLTAQTVTTIAGDGGYNSSGWQDSGDGGPAISAHVYHPKGLAYDVFGNLYISEEIGVVRKVDTLGNIFTIVGGPDATLHDELAMSTEVSLRNPYGLAVDNARGYLYIAETGGNTVKRLHLSTLMIETVAGNGDTPVPLLANGSPSVSIGDGGAALNSSLNQPTFLSVDSAGSLYVVDSGYNRIRKINFIASGATTLAYEPASLDHSELVRNPDGTFKRTYKNGNVLEFNADGTQSKQTDRVGRSTVYQYDSSSPSRLSKVFFPTGQFFQYNYIGNLLSSIEDSSGRVTTLNHDANNNLTKINYPDGSNKKFEYANGGLLTKQTNEENFSTTYAYNEWNRIQSIQLPDANNSVIQINDSGSATASNNYDGTNIPKNFGLEQDEVSDRIVNARSNETKFVKEMSGYVSTIVDAKGTQIKIDRNQKGRPTKITRFNNQSQEVSHVSFVYDVNNPLKKRQDDLLSQTDSATGVTTSQTYDDFGNVLTTTDGKGKITTNTYDTVTGQLRYTVYPLGNAVQYNYNTSGLLVQKIIQNGPNSIQINYEYNSLGQLIKETNVGGSVKRYVYDLAGNIMQLITTSGTADLVVNFEYDDFNRLTKVISPKNEVTRYEYFKSGKLSKIIDPRGKETLFELDSMSRVKKKTDTLGRIYQYLYDGNGNITQLTEPNGNISTFEYDQIDKLIVANYVDDRFEFQYNDLSEEQFQSNRI